MTREMTTEEELNMIKHLEKMVLELNHYFKLLPHLSLTRVNVFNAKLSLSMAISAQERIQKDKK